MDRSGLWMAMVALGGFSVLTSPPGAAAKSPTGCDASAEVGWIARIDLLSADRAKSSPVLIRSRASHPLAETTPLCADDVVRNPSGSNMRLWLRVVGRELVSVEPGDRPYHVRAPGWGARFRSWLSVLDGLSYWRRSRDGRAAPARTRSGESTLCRYEPGVVSTKPLNAVADWGPIVFAWGCTDPPFGDWTVTIETSGTRQSTTTATNMIRIDPRHCDRTCTIIVARNLTRQRVASVQLDIVPADAAELPADLRLLDMNERNRAAIGSWLMRNGRTAWRLQAASLLWSAGCRVPAAAQVAAGWYGAPTPEDICLGP